MPRLIKKIFLIQLSLVVFLGTLPILPASAIVSSCEANVTPSQVNPAITTNFSIVINNTSSQDISWVRISRPSANFTLGGSVASGWTRVVTQTTATFTGMLVAGGLKNFFLTNVQVANLQAAPANWIVEVSDDGSGANPITCGGALSTQIGDPDLIAPTISNLAVASVTTNSAVISWNTDEPASSIVNYGLNNSYGKTAREDSFKTSHSLTLTGLSASTTYHFEAVSLDPSDNSSSSANNTFTTSSYSTESKNSNAPASVSAVQKPPAVVSDTELPKVWLNTDLSKPFKTVPTISGEASDDNLIYLIEYSLDDGSNWLPVDQTSGLNKDKISFTFKPLNLPDDNHPLLVRAFDQNNNQGMSDRSFLIIDNVFPALGQNVVTFGPQLSGIKDNTFLAVRGLDQKISILTIGGVTELTIRATNKTANKIFALNRVPGSSLWSGVLAFETAGDYSLEAEALDGANNKVEKQLNNVSVFEPSQLLDQDGKPIAAAMVTVYYYDLESKSWVVWEASAFGQVNPQKSNSNGEFHLYLPAGKYYLKIEAEKYRKFVSNIFALDKSQALSVTTQLEKALSIGLGKFRVKLPELSLKTNNLVFQNLKTGVGQSLKGKEVPDFNLPSTGQRNVASLDLVGKPTVIAFLSTWSPQAEEQLSQLKNLKEREKYNILVFVSLEPREKIKAYQKIGGYDIEFVLDKDGMILDKFRVNSAPTILFVSRNLKIENITYGVLSKEELQKELIRL